MIEFRPWKSWTLRTLYSESNYMTFPSAVRLLRFLRRKSKAQTPHVDDVVALTFHKPFSSTVHLRSCRADIETLREIVHRGVYNRVSEFLTDCRYVIDLGANIGLASLLFASLYPASTVASVEPAADNFALMRRNLTPLIKANRCIPFQAALWRTDCTLSLCRPKGELVFNSIRADDSVTTPEQIDAMSMSTLITKSGFPYVDFLKVDIEGAELQLFQGSTEWLSRVKVLAIEFHGTSRIDSGFDRIMAAQGFDVYDDDVHTVWARRKSS